VYISVREECHPYKSESRALLAGLDVEDEEEAADEDGHLDQVLPVDVGQPVVDQLEYLHANTTCRYVTVNGISPREYNMSLRHSQWNICT